MDLPTLVGHNQVTVLLYCLGGQVKDIGVHNSLIEYCEKVTYCCPHPVFQRRHR